MAEDLDLPEWMEWALGKVSLLLVLGGGGAFALGVAALFGGLQPAFGLYLLIGGPAAVVVGIGLYLRHAWAIFIALLLCLGATTVCGFGVASGLGSGVPDTRPMVWGVVLVIGDLALLFLLAKAVGRYRESGMSELVCEVDEVGPGLQCRLRLRVERPVATVPRQLAGAMSRVVPGDEVKVAGPLPGGGYRVLAFQSKRAEPSAAADRPR